MRKKIGMLLLCASVAGTVLTACGDKKDEDSSVVESTERPQSDDDTESTDDTDEPEDTPESDTAQTTQPVASQKTNEAKTSAPTKKSNSSTSTKSTKKPQATEKKAMSKMRARIENACEKVTMKELYVSAYGQDAWGENLLTKSIAYEKTSKRISIIMPAEQQRWDVKVVDSKGKTSIFRELDVSECDTSNITITLTYDDEGNPIAIAV